MFSTEYYCLVASLREWTLDSDTKGFDVREILDEILDELTAKDRKAVELLYAYYDCENIISLRNKRNRHNNLANLSAEQLKDVLENRNYALLPENVAAVVKLYNEVDDEERDEDVVVGDNFEHALFDAYYKDLSASKVRFLKKWGEFDRTLRNISAAVAAREAGRVISEVTVGGGEIVAQLAQSSASDFGLRGELQYIDSVISAITEETNIVEKERKIDAVRWSEAEDIAINDYFDIDYILSYLVKVNIVARWTLLSPEVGREMLDKLIASLDASALVEKQAKQ
ncbi:MAG: DUF2764 family protein [Alistipes sp.]|jgi:hypothetical protein|nr:DUF2764 family protein [Alistipes sp.]